MKTHIRAFFVVMSANLIGCAAFFSIPNQRFESPTVSGGWLKGAVGNGYESPTYIQTVRDISMTPPDSSGAEISRSVPSWGAAELSAFVLDLRLGLGSRFEISSANGMSHLKFQFLGSPRAVAKEKEFVGAVTVDNFSIGRSGDESVNNVKNEYKINGGGAGGSLILGYRQTKNFIYYVNANYLDFSADTTVTQPAQTYIYKGSGYQFGSLLGIRREVARGFYYAVEWSYSKTKWTALAPREFGTAGAIFGFTW